MRKLVFQQWVTCIVAFAVGAFGVSGAVGAAVPAKTVPPKEYVKQLCRGLKDVQSALNVFISSDDLSAYQAQALENDAAIITKAENARTQLSRLIPSNGKRKVAGRPIRSRRARATTPRSRTTGRHQMDERHACPRT